jgi:hypothetical protein
MRPVLTPDLMPNSERLEKNSPIHPSIHADMKIRRKEDPTIVIVNALVELLLLPELPLVPFGARGGGQNTVQELTALVWKIDDRLVQCVNDEATWHQIHATLASIKSHVQPRRVIAPVPLLQL